MKKFLKTSKDIIDEITSAIHFLKSSECYTTLLDDINDPHVVSFTEIRWISLYETLKSSANDQESINSYYRKKMKYESNCKKSIWSF